VPCTPSLSSSHLSLNFFPYQKARQNKPKRPPPSAYLAEFREREEKHQKQIAITVMEEAYLMESKAYGCVDEANAYAKALGLKTRYSIYARDDNQSSKQQFLRTKSSLNDLLLAQKTRQETQAVGLTQDFYLTHITEIMKGCGNRLEKMCIEVMGVAGDPTQLISLEKFYAEHNKLQLEIRRKRNLMSTSEREINIGIENNEINKCDEKGVSMRRRTIGIDQNNLLLLQQNESKNKTKKEAKKEDNPKQITEEKLIKILEDTREVTRILEEQLKELKMRGWNENIL
jgi:hypothetical protein